MNKNLVVIYDTNSNDYYKFNWKNIILVPFHYKFLIYFTKRVAILLQLVIFVPTRFVIAMRITYALYFFMFRGARKCSTKMQGQINA